MKFSRYTFAAIGAGQASAFALVTYLSTHYP